MRASFISSIALGLAAFACTPPSTTLSAPRVAAEPTRVAAAPEDLRAQNVLCADIGDDCSNACPDAEPFREHVDCLLRYRFAEDPEALTLARELFDRKRVLLGVESRSSLESYGGTRVGIRPALPLGPYRHHLVWLRESLEGFSSLVDALSARAPRPIVFRPAPIAFRFYRTEERAFPSAYGANGVIGYNVEGPLHTNLQDVRETLFHELFHLNDEWNGAWSKGALAGIFETIVGKCRDDHACFAPFAPHDTVVPGGTYYGFDERARDVREYAAELALRYLREHEAILGGKPPIDPPFKCLTEENRIAWTLLADTFFGGVDLSPRCEA